MEIGTFVFRRAGFEDEAFGNGAVDGRVFFQSGLQGLRDLETGKPADIQFSKGGFSGPSLRHLVDGISFLPELRSLG